MNKKAAYQWIKDRVFMGIFDARTLESPCKEIVTYLRENPDDKEIFTNTLSDFIENEELVAQQHVENTAYLVVNLRSRDALEKFISKLRNAEDTEGVLRRLAIATIRSFPCSNQEKSAYLPLLIEWLKLEETATVAYEAICQIYPEDTIAYFLWALSHHTTNNRFIQKMLTDIYFDHRQEHPGLQALEKLNESWKQLIPAIREHPLIPDAAKEEALQKRPDIETTQILEQLVMQLLRLTKDIWKIVEVLVKLYPPISVYRAFMHFYNRTGDSEIMAKFAKRVLRITEDNEAETLLVSYLETGVSGFW